MPLLPKPNIEDRPQRFAPYDKRSKAEHASDTLLHGYVSDCKLRGQLTKPHLWVERFRGCWGIVTPDFSVWRDDPLDLRVLATRLSREVGAFHSSRGHRVIPSLRWAGPSDYGFCFDGVEPGSPVSVSNYGLWNDPLLREGFLLGLPEMMDRLAPVAVFIHGTTKHKVFKELARRTELIPIATRWASLGRSAA